MVISIKFGLTVGVSPFSSECIWEVISGVVPKRGNVLFLPPNLVLCCLVSGEGTLLGNIVVECWKAVVAWGKPLLLTPGVGLFLEILCWGSFNIGVVFPGVILFFAVCATSTSFGRNMVVVTSGISSFPDVCMGIVIYTGVTNPEDSVVVL